MKLKDKVAVITGGNSGIGLGIAEEFKDNGARVVICGRDRKTLDSTQKHLGKDALVVQADVSNLADIDMLFKKTAERFGKIDTLVVNAGVAVFVPVDQVDEAMFDKIVNINFKGAYFTIQKALPYLNDGASVILISSIAQSKGIGTTSVYSATKAALRSLARTLSSDLLSRGIRVNVVSPGPIETPIFDKLGMPADQVAGAKEGFAGMVPLKRLGTSAEVAKAVLFFASQDSSFVIGEEIQVDGGMANL